MNESKLKGKALTNEELDKIVGGTTKEFNDICKAVTEKVGSDILTEAMRAYTYSRGDAEDKQAAYRQVFSDYLAQKYGVSAVIRKDNYENNVYIDNRTGKELSHMDVLRRINDDF